MGFGSATHQGGISALIIPFNASTFDVVLDRPPWKVMLLIHMLQKEKRTLKHKLN